MFDVVLYSVLGAFYLFIVLSQMVVVILENRQPVKTVAWLMVLFFLPIVGLAIYFFFGRNRKREHFVSRACASQLARRSAVRFYQGGIPEVPQEHKQLIRLFRRQSGAFPYADNKVRFFADGLDMLDCLLRDIAAARHHIHVEFYIIEDDRVGRRVREALAAKAREGVSVRLVYDDVGCWNVKGRFFKEMERDGVQVAPFLPVRFPKLTSKVDFRNHRKIVVIDGIIGYVGGMNLAERYVYPAGGGRSAWRDTHVRIMGNAVGGLQRAFLSDWFVAAGQTITAQVYYPREEECRRIMDGDREPYASRNALVQVVTSIPTAPWPDIMQGMILALMRARHYCYLQSPYFMPTERMLFALQTAALAGVDVRLMLPERAEFEHGAIRPSVDASLRGDELQEIVVERAALLCGLCSPSAQPVELVAVVGLRGNVAMHLVVFEHVVCRVFHLHQRTVYFGSGNALRVGRAAPALHLRRVPFLRADGISTIKLQHVAFPAYAHPDLAFARIPACIYLLQVKGDSSLNIHGT